MRPTCARPGCHRGEGARPHPAGLDAARHQWPGVRTPPAPRRPHPRGADHHADRARRGATASTVWTRGRRLTSSSRFPRELIARIKAVMRRTHGDDADGVIALGGLRLDSAAHRVFAGQDSVAIGPTEYRLLHFFATTPTRLLAQPATGPRVGRQRVRGGTHRGRAHPPPAQDPGAARSGRPGADRARRRLPLSITPAE